MFPNSDFFAGWHDEPDPHGGDMAEFYTTADAMYEGSRREEHPRDGAYFIPSAAIALHFERMHECSALLPCGWVACRRCKRVLNLEEFARNDCEPKADG